MLIFANFLHSTAFVFGLLTLLWAISVAVKDASLVDIFWGFGFLVVGAVCLYFARDITPYMILLAALPILWGLRLSLYLGKRNLGHGEDPRYVAMRKRAAKKGLSERNWRDRSLFTIYFGQGLLILIVSAPIWVGIATSVETVFDGAESTTRFTKIGTLSIIGTMIWLIGFLFEAIGDWQLSRFLKNNKDYDGPYENKPVLDTGLWKYTRHPNYFGNSLMWWGIWLVACQAPWGWVTIFAPILMTFLLTRVSGRDMLERQLKKRPAYQDYMSRTSGFIPRPPKPRV